ncbi:MAG TPA: AMIN domain-containing protein [Terriglobales bacterium]|nr:AMIN domain-containing protein [Terriglobales bacterium]
MKGILQVNLLLLLLSAVAASSESNVAEIRRVQVKSTVDKIQVDVTLTASVIPSVIIATRPDRLVLQLPNTAAPAKQQRAAVNQNGVKAVRVGLNRADPPVTRVVVDLDHVHPYEITMTGNTITLTVLAVRIAARSRQRSKAPLLAESGSVIGRFFHRERTDTPTTHDSTTVLTNSPEGLRINFRVKHVAEGVAYLNGGRSSGLAEGMRLLIWDSSSCGSATSKAKGSVVAELGIIAVAQTSAAAEIRTPKRSIKPGDCAYLSAEDIERLAEERTLAATGKRPLMNAFTEGNSPMGKGRGAGNPSPSPEDSRVRMRIGLDYSGVRSRGSTHGGSSQRGLAVRSDITRIGGTYWNLQGYWRARLSKHSQPSEQTVRDYLDKTYTMQLYYDNPNSKWVGGFGRLYLPWAASLDTIDGGYVGRRVATGVTAAIFAGSTPDPTSWHYNPDRRIGGAFVNFEGGSYDPFHYTGTVGVALSTLKWHLERPYIFFENALSSDKYISVYHSLIVDSPQGFTTSGMRLGAGISRSYLTLHIQPNRRISFDVHDNYLRDVPTAATQLIGTGLVDKLLYQGLNVGVRAEPVRHIAVYSTIGQSDRTGDTKRSLNQTYGFTWSEIGRTGLRADVHYSKFDSSFARGDYRVLSLSRHLTGRLLWDAQVGNRSLTSPSTMNNRSLFVDTSLDTNLTGHSFLQSGYTIERGVPLNYDQWYISLGYRLDVRGPAR